MQEKNKVIECTELFLMAAIGLIEAILEHNQVPPKRINKIVKHKAVTKMLNVFISSLIYNTRILIKQ